jgi:hypothetical protein
VKVVKIEEKGSDVNLATRLLIDAFMFTSRSRPEHRVTEGGRRARRQ